MTIATEFQVIESATEKEFFVGGPLPLLGSKEREWTRNARLLKLTEEEYVNWMIARGAKKFTNCNLFSFTEKKKASKVAKELTKAYLKYRMGK